MAADWIQVFMKDVNENLSVLPDTPDTTLLVLKSHLLIEQELERWLEVVLPNPDAFLGRRPRFAQKLTLLKSLVPEPPYIVNLWEIVGKLNDIRNDLAHRLKPERVEARLDAILEELISGLSIPRDSVHMPVEGTWRTRMTLIMIVWFLAHIRGTRIRRVSAM